MDNPSRWIPLESNPEVMNDWAKKAGLLLSQAHFEDVYGLDEELLAMLPQPVLAIVLLFPVTDETERVRAEDEAQKDPFPVDPTVMWIKQTIGNACGTIGIMHALANTNVAFGPESPLEKFIDACQGKTPEERAKFLETTELFANIHAQAASSGQTAVPTNMDTNLHFTCFVKAPDPAAREQQIPSHAVSEKVPTKTTSSGMRLIELDGRRSGPVDRGECPDFLQAVAKFVKSYYIDRSASHEFSMLCLTGAKD